MPAGRIEPRSIRGLWHLPTLSHRITLADFGVEKSGAATQLRQKIKQRFCNKQYQNSFYMDIDLDYTKGHKLVNYI